MPREHSTLVESLRARRRVDSRERRVVAKTRKAASTDDIADMIGLDVLVLEIGGKERRFNVREELSIVNSDADKTLDSHAERLAIWGNLAETVKHEIALAEIDLDDIRKSRYLAYRAAQRDAEHRKAREGKKAEKWTDREITAVIETEPEVVKARKALAVRKQCLGYCMSMVRAFTQRGRMIVKWGKMPEHADDNLDS